MPRFSNAMFIALNLISLAMGFAAVFCSAYVQMHDGSACQKTLEMPLLVTGLFLLIVSTLGLVGACCRTDWLLCIYLFVMLISILGLIAFTVFVLIVTNTFVGKKVSQNRLHDYSYWLQNRLADGKNWQEIRSCLADANVCRNLGNKDLKDWSLVQVLSFIYFILLPYIERLVLYGHNLTWICISEELNLWPMLLFRNAFGFFLKSAFKVIKAFL